MNQLKFSLFCIFLVICSISLFGCTASQPSPKAKDIREVAWNDLRDSEKEDVIGGWEEATFKSVKADPTRYHLTDHSSAGKDVILVTFHSRHHMLLGDITKLIDPQSKESIGRSGL